MKPIFKFSLVLSVVVPFVALAQPAKTPAAPKAGGASASESAGVFKIRGGDTTYDTERGIGHMTKNVVVTQTGEDIVIYAQDATFDKNRNVANASVQLRVETRDSTIRGLKLFADFNERTATITGNVVINSHGKNDGMAAGLRGETQKKPIRVTCDRVDWDYDIRQATALGNIQIYQGNNRGTCNKIIFNERRNIINLLGDVRFSDNKKNAFVAQNVIVYVEEGRVQINGTGTMTGPVGQGEQNPQPSKTRRAPKSGAAFGPAPTLPADLLGQAPPSPLPTAQPTATEEPVPTPRPDEPSESLPTK